MGNVERFVREVDIKIDELQNKRIKKIAQTAICASFFLNRWTEWVDKKLKCTNVSLKEGTSISSPLDVVIDNLLFRIGVLGH